MALPPAPLRHLAPPDPSGGEGEGFWLTASDGVRLRVALWRPSQGARGTVLMFPGRTEYIEKYRPVATDLVARDFAVLVIDWRGQGASDRLIADQGPGHVRSFDDYQRDVAAMIEAAEALALPRPWHLLSHSMGGAIALRALHAGLPVATAAFSAPMCAIRIANLPDRAASLAASGLARIAIALGRAESPLPPSRGQGGVEPGEDDFAANLLTSDRPNWERLAAEAAAWPDLMIGAPTFGWVSAALAECRALAALPSPDLPALFSLSGDEAIVSKTAIRDRATRWPGATLLDLPGARHEALFELPATRARLMKAIAALQDQHS